MKKSFFFRSSAPIVFIILLEINFSSCRKLISIPPPTNDIVTSQVFSTNALAENAIGGLYLNIINSGTSGGPYYGLSSDELFNYAGVQSPDLYDINNNKILAQAYEGIQDIAGTIWDPYYSHIYGANAIIEGIQASTSKSLSDSVRTEITGEAEFVRAFCYFYLTNSFGDVPLPLSIAYATTNTLPKTPQAQVYQQIVTDLLDAQKKLPTTYPVDSFGRTRPIQSAATALLARVYLYTKDWKDAETQASAVIGNSQYALESDLNNVFLTTSREAIWQLQINSFSAFKNATPDGYTYIPYPSMGEAYYTLTPQLLAAFEPGDMRRVLWVDSTNNTYNDPASTTWYYYPYKYTVGLSQESPTAAITQYYMMLRLGEQYLIRAEARAEQGNISGGLSDLNVIRERAKLRDTTATSQADLLTLIYHERQVELFAEWGHRWFDLKRTGLAQSVLSKIQYKQPFQATQLLYPIPLADIQSDHNLIQNPGYQ